jgi:hypothetical protein
MFKRTRLAGPVWPSRLSLVLVALAATAVSVYLPTTVVEAVGPADQVNIPVTGSPVANITAAPSALSPTFSLSIHDYVATCQHAGANVLTLTLTASSGGSLQVGNQSGSQVSFPITVGEGQAAVVKATAGADYWIRCLPHDFPTLQVSKPGNPPDGYYLTGNVTASTDGRSGTYAMILDPHGTPVWYQAAPGGAINVELLANNTVAWAPSLGPGVGADPNGGFMLHHLDTQTSTLLRAAAGLPADPHELLQLSNGHFMMFATPLKSRVNLSGLPGITGNTIVDCVVQELDSQGVLLRSWRASDHIDVHEATRAAMVSYNSPTPNAADVYHCNSIEVQPMTGNLLLSFRHEDAVYLVNWTSGGTIWKLGGNSIHEAGSQYMPLSNGNQFYAQHDARFRPGGNISIYDDESTKTTPARGIEYAIDPAGGTANGVFGYSSQPSAQATGSFRRYADNRDSQHPDTDNVVGWGFRSGSGYTEVNTAGQVLMNMTFPNGEKEYRVVKEPLTALDINLLRATAGLPRPFSPSTSWQSLGGTLTSKPGAASWAANRLDAFARGTDNQMWHISWSGGGWSGWEPLGGSLTSGPGAVSWSSGRIDVFVRGTDNQLWHRWWDGTRWLGWEGLGGVLSSAPAVASRGANSLDVVVEGTDQQLWHKWWDGSQWVGWEALGGRTDADPGEASWGPGRLDVFTRNTDGTLNHKWYDNGGWSAWEWFPGSLTSGPAATSAMFGQVDVAAVGADSVPQRMEFTQGWQNWQSLGGLSLRTPALVSRDSLDEDVFVAGTDNTLYFTQLSTTPGAARTRKPAPPSKADAERL